MVNKQKTITILGAGYVGLTTAAILSVCGYRVYAVDPNTNRLKAIKGGKSFFFEKGLDDVISKGIENGNLIPTDSYEESVPNSSIIISCVGTPDKPDGSSNLDYVFDAAEESAKYLLKDSIYVQKSTVPVGTGEKIENIFINLGLSAHYVSNPEFLRESTALQDTLYFDRIVAGGNDKKSVNRILDVYHDIEHCRDQIAKLGNISDDIDDKSAIKNGLYIATSLNSAELIKVTSNAFLALKISFANSIALLTDKVGADINDVMKAVGADPRIGAKFLNAGRGYGGGCFPKDVSGLIVSAQDHGVDLEIMKAAKNVNDRMPGYVVKKIIDNAKLNSKKTKITVLGLSFKSGTSDVRRSPGIKIANIFVKQGFSIKAFDPEANDEAKKGLDPHVTITNTVVDALDGSDVVIIATDWPDFLSLDLNKTKSIMTGKLFVDAVNRFDKASIKEHGFDYMGIGR
jgi:UDPglucose 6-dehydrogenase